MVDFIAHPSEVPAPDWIPEGATRRVRSDGWELSSYLLREMTLSGRSLTREISINFMTGYSDLDLNNPNSVKQREALERRCNRAFVCLKNLGLIEIQHAREEDDDDDSFEIFPEIYPKNSAMFFGNLDYLVATLTPKGENFCRDYGWNPVATDWEILQKYHRADVEFKHAKSILLFAMHARLRGWDVMLVPGATGDRAISPPYSPDVRITKGRMRIYVEVETRKVDKKYNKWRLNTLAQRFVAVCALTPARRESLEKEIRNVCRSIYSTDFSRLNFDLANNPTNLSELWANQP